MFEALVSGDPKNAQILRQACIPNATTRSDADTLVRQTLRHLADDDVGVSSMQWRRAGRHGEVANHQRVLPGSVSIVPEFTAAVQSIMAAWVAKTTAGVVTSGFSTPGELKPFFTTSAWAITLTFDEPLDYDSEIVFGTSGIEQFNSAMPSILSTSPAGRYSADDLTGLRLRGQGKCCTLFLFTAPTVEELRSFERLATQSTANWNEVRARFSNGKAATFSSGLSFYSAQALPYSVNMADETSSFGPVQRVALQVGNNRLVLSTSSEITFDRCCVDFLESAWPAAGTPLQMQRPVFVVGEDSSGLILFSVLS